MTEVPPSATVRSIELGSRLRKRRNELGLTAKQVAAQLGGGDTNIPPMEHGKRKLTVAKLEDLMMLYGIKGKDRAELTALRDQADQREWWDDYARLYSEDFLRFIGMEAGADEIREYAAETIPGLLQTADYARGMIHGGSVYIRPVDVGPRVESRLARQNRIDGKHPVPFTVVIGQTALRQEVGSREIMAQQLDKLIKLSTQRRKQVRIHVMPYSAGAHPLIGGGLKMLSFESQWVPDVTWQETATTGSLNDKVTVVRELTASFEEAVERALNPDDSVEMMKGVRKQMETS